MLDDTFLVSILALGHRKLTLQRPGGSNGPLIGFLDLKIEALKESKWNFQYL